MIDKNITFIGPGAMAEAIFGGLIKNSISQPTAIRISGPNQDRCDLLAQKYGVIPFSNNKAAVDGADIVILSVKPQRLNAVMADLRSALPKEALVISIIAGATLKKLSHGLSHSSVVRTMPNTPSQIGEGITVWTNTSNVTESQKEITQKILSALGQEIHVEDEHYLDMATALSGTGPAYVFMFMESLIDAGVHMGLPRRISEQLVLQTITGSVDYYKQNNVHVSALRNQVTSPGGTSAEALYYLEKAGFRTAISRAVWAAYQRSLELGKDQPVHIPDTKSSEGPFNS